jgi:hypothetical protein
MFHAQILPLDRIMVAHHRSVSMFNAIAWRDRANSLPLVADALH